MGRPLQLQRGDIRRRSASSVSVRSAKVRSKGTGVPETRGGEDRSLACQSGTFLSITATEGRNRLAEGLISSWGEFETESQQVRKSRQRRREGFHGLFYIHVEESSVKLGAPSFRGVVRGGLLGRKQLGEKSTNSIKEWPDDRLFPA